jgi:hypothetical protein
MAQVVGVVWCGITMDTGLRQRFAKKHTEYPGYILADGHAFPRCFFWLKEIEGLDGEGERVGTRGDRRIGMQE